MPRVKTKRPPSPDPAPAKRIKKEQTGSCYDPMPRADPITIDGDSDVEMGDRTLLSAEKEVAELDKLISEAKQRHKVQRGTREAAEEALALKHSLEEQAEQDEIMRLDELRATAALRLRRYIRTSIVKSRTMPSRVMVNAPAPTKQEELLEYAGRGCEESSEASPELMSSVLTIGSTRATSIKSPSDRSGITPARGQRRKTLRAVKEEENSTQTEDDDFEHHQNSDSESDYMNVRKVNPNYHLRDMVDRNEAEDEVNSEVSEDDTDMAMGKEQPLSEPMGVSQIEKLVQFPGSKCRSISLH